MNFPEYFHLARQPLQGLHDIRGLHQHCRPVPAMLCPLVFLHYHLRPGGVNTVIEHQARALRAAGHRVVVASGEPDDSGRWRDIEVVVDPALGYASAPPDDATIHRLADKLTSLSSGGVLHVHNPYLGKNTSYPRLMRRLVENGCPLVFHQHDFAENGRDDLLARFPDRTDWYPVASNAAWLVLSPDDDAILAAAGIPARALHVMPNPVVAPDLPASPTEAGLFWYPTRGLRRKNLGEIVLLAALAPRGVRFATSQRPDNPSHAAIHDAWAARADALGLPVTFAASPTARPARAVTTSIQEGFGYAFAEPWLAGLPVCGRLLPAATRQLRDAGLNFPACYTALRLPAGWVTRKSLLAAAKNLPAPSAFYAKLKILSAPTSTNWDFGELPEPLQSDVINRLARSPAAASRFTFEMPDSSRLTPPEWFALAMRDDTATINHNRARLSAGFSPDAVATRLTAIYSRLLDAEPGLQGHADAAIVLEFFRQPDRFRFLSLPP